MSNPTPSDPAPSLPQAEPPMHSLDDIIASLMQTQGGYTSEKIAIGFERAWLTTNKQQKQKGTIPLTPCMWQSWNTLHPAAAASTTHTSSSSNPRRQSWCHTHATTLILCCICFATYAVRSMFSLASSFGSLSPNTNQLQQMYVAVSFIVGFLALRAALKVLETSISTLLTNPPIVIHDVISIAVQPSRLIFRLGPFVEVVHYDPLLVSIHLVSNVYIPYPAKTRRALYCSIRHNENQQPMLATHTCRVLIACALASLNASMYDVAVGRNPNCDPHFYSDKLLRLKIGEQELQDQRLGTYSDNIEAWRFSSMKDPLTHLLNSTRVGMHNLDKQFGKLKVRNHNGAVIIMNCCYD